MAIRGLVQGESPYTGMDPVDHFIVFWADTGQPYYVIKKLQDLQEEDLPLILEGELLVYRAKLFPVKMTP